MRKDTIHHSASKAAPGPAYSVLGVQPPVACIPFSVRPQLKDPQDAVGFHLGVKEQSTSLEVSGNHSLWSSTMHSSLCTLTLRKRNVSVKIPQAAAWQPA